MRGPHLSRIFHLSFRRQGLQANPPQMTYSLPPCELPPPALVASWRMARSALACTARCNPRARPQPQRTQRLQRGPERKRGAPARADADSPVTPDWVAERRFRRSVWRVSAGRVCSFVSGPAAGSSRAELGAQPTSRSDPEAQATGRSSIEAPSAHDADHAVRRCGRGVRPPTGSATPPWPCLMPAGLYVPPVLAYNTLHAYTTVSVAQLVRAPGCGPGGRGFESHHSPLADRAPPGRRFRDMGITATGLAVSAAWGLTGSMARRGAATRAYRVSPSGGLVRRAAREPFERP